MPRFKATIAYDGTLYHGWQIQPGSPTVQGALAESLRHITGEITLPQGAGRTDTGVHALGQVAHFDLSSTIPAENLHRALNRSLPPSIRILALTIVPEDFHARHHAIHKTYEYRILPRTTPHETICPPTLAPYLWTVPHPLDLTLLNQSSTHILGTHDFTSFAATNPDQSTRHVAEAPQHRVSGAPQPRVPHSSWSHHDAWGYSSPSNPVTPNTRTIQASAWLFDEQTDPPILRYRITGTGFLYHMVRNLVGTFANPHRYSPESIPVILAARDRRAAGPTAPPHGLFLAEVVY